MVAKAYWIQENRSHGLTASRSRSMMVSSSSKCRSFISSFFIWVSTSNATRLLIFLSSTCAKCYKKKKQKTKQKKTIVLTWEKQCNRLYALKTEDGLTLETSAWLSVPCEHLTLKKSTSYEEINKVVKKASVSDPRGFLRYTEDHGCNSVNSTLSSWFLGMTMSMATATVL